MTTFIPQPGEYDIRVTVFDDSGARAIDAQRITVVQDAASITVDATAFAHAVPMNGLDAQRMRLTIPAGIDIASAEIWFGHLTHDDARSDSLMGRVVYDVEGDTFEVLNPEAGSGTRLASHSSIPNILDATT